LKEGARLLVSGLRVHFRPRAGWLRPRGPSIRAVDGVSLAVGRGETLALVGESGCGKTTLGRALVRLVEAREGEILFVPDDLSEPAVEKVLRDEGHPARRTLPDGRLAVDVRRVSGGDLRRLRRRLQIVFQDPYGSLDPRQTAGSILAEPLAVHGLARGRARSVEVDRLLERVGLRPDLRSRYPHEFSGGERQRIGIARALALRPSFVVLDEPLSALDVSVQAQILALLRDLQVAEGLSYLFISHDLAVVRALAQRAAVMYLGEIVEEAPVRQLFEAPLHPYTKALLSAVPTPDPESRRSVLLLPGEPPSAASPPAGCRFHPRCPIAVERCRVEPPALRSFGGGRLAACHLATTDSPASSAAGGA
jgi:oligopeptide/dipeptide ABC transporter ATP-binding protein